MSQIEVHELSKTYKETKRRNGVFGSIVDLFSKNTREKEAIKKISFNIDEGECIGYIGPNGAGKSTTIKILAGILAPTEGSITVKGIVPWKKRIEHVKRIGVIFGNRRVLWNELSPRQSFNLLSQMYEIRDNDFLSKKLNTLLTQLNINTIIDKPARELSLGQRMRCEFVAAFLHSPDIVFLDEPTIGLDFESREIIHNFITSMNKDEKVTIIYTSHDLKEVEKITNRLIVINSGVIIFDGKSDDLRKMYKYKKNITVKFEDSFNNDSFNELLSKYNIENQVINHRDNSIRIKCDLSKYSIQNIVNDIITQKNVCDISINDVDIEEVIGQIYENS